MVDTPEKKSEYAKRVLFGGPKPAAVGTAVPAAVDKQGTGGSSSRSGSQGSTASAPGGAIYSVPGTPRSTTNGELRWLPNTGGGAQRPDARTTIETPSKCNCAWWLNDRSTAVYSYMYT